VGHKLPDTFGDGYTVVNTGVEAAEASSTDTSFSLLSCEWVWQILLLNAANVIDNIKMLWTPPF
jgi:hypothetical protein